MNAECSMQNTKLMRKSDGAGRYPIRPRTILHSSFIIDHSHRGSVLPAVLIILLMLGLLAAGFSFEVFAHRNNTVAIQDALQTRLAAEAGIHYVALFLRTNRLDIDSWYSNPEQFHNVIVWTPGGDETVLGTTQLPDELDTPQAFRFSIVADDIYDDELGLRYGITDENSKLNINTATEGQIARLIGQVYEPDPEADEPVTAAQLARSIVYWREAASNPLEDEDAFYNELETPYRIKHAPFETVEELLMVRGMDGRILFGEDYDRNGLLSANEDDEGTTFPPDNGDGFLNRGLIPFVTVYSRDLNTATDNRPRVNQAGSGDVFQARLEEFIDDPEVITYILNTNVTEKFWERDEEEQSQAQPEGGDGEMGDGSSGQPERSPDVGSDQGRPGRDGGRGRNDGGRDENGGRSGGGRGNGVRDDNGGRRPPPGRERDDRNPGRNEGKTGRSDTLTRGIEPRGSVPDPALNGPEAGNALKVQTASLRQTSQPVTGRQPSSGRRPGGSVQTNDNQSVDRETGNDNRETTGNNDNDNRPADENENSNDNESKDGEDGALDEPEWIPTAASYLRPKEPGGTSPVTLELLPILLDNITFRDVSQREVPGLININTAPPQVLRCLSALSEEQIAAIIEHRAEVPSEMKTTTAWLLTDGVIDLDTFENIAEQICARSDRFTIESLGYSDHRGGMTRLQVVLEMRGPVPQIMYYRDLTALGTRFPIWYDENGEPIDVQRVR